MTCFVAFKEKRGVGKVEALSQKTLLKKIKTELNLYLVNQTDMNLGVPTANRAVAADAMQTAAVPLAHT
jgi:RNA polymerase-interacting CarD/CdnL/TRCF family regulator